MPVDPEPAKVVTAHREVAASAEEIFELIADPSQQSRWDGNDNLAEAPTGQRIRGAGETFTMTLTGAAMGAGTPRPSTDHGYPHL